jgi:hypothetical protein
MTHEQETLWLAGLFEGEGCFTTRRNRHEIRIALSMTDEDVVLKAAIAVGGPSVRVHSRKRKVHYKPTFEFELVGDRAVTFCQRILPFMGQRRKARIEFLLELASHRISRSESGKIGARKRWGIKRDNFTLSLLSREEKIG